MFNDIKVEFEIKAYGEEKTDDYNDSFKGYEVARNKVLSKEITLGELENYVSTIFEEVKGDYGQPPEQLTAKITIRAKEKEGEITYLG
ncbi:hypothetical protein MJ3_12270 [Salimicrobium jeotgali]|uniref:Uncharacterized protein n=1 Tax=Salimicrobium jeotgali TaxID=1230341 RepID=K2G8R2_9BACI|nr:MULTISPECIES: hypothetical protein [Salimicrobium]EKE30742.1 hypothetical protein MJ3_12270 [Salimicrobium jeotgali]MBM7697128.1 hypothetical protein [Salimicrobium jeotgali]